MALEVVSVKVGDPVVTEVVDAEVEGTVVIPTEVLETLGIDVGVAVSVVDGGIACASVEVAQADRFPVLSHATAPLPGANVLLVQFGLTGAAPIPSFPVTIARALIKITRIAPTQTILHIRILDLLIERSFSIDQLFVYYYYMVDYSTTIIITIDCGGARF